MRCPPLVAASGEGDGYCDEFREGKEPSEERRRGELSPGMPLLAKMNCQH